MACSCKKRGLCPSCGGGTRAAALAYGVLEALAAIPAVSAASRTGFWTK